ncbi:MAG: hypothetical protein JXA06_04725 [Bacteroidetes bacterium]|nr:hypothetical protein [Bacteroidota bacterium]
MINKIIKLLTLICLIACIAWYFNKPDWEPLITGIGIFSALIGLEFAETKSIKNNPDIVLYRKFIFLIPSATLIEFLKNHDFGGPFDSEILRPLDDFVAYWDNAEHEFVNSKIEKKKEMLLSVIHDFLSCIGHNTYPTHNDSQSIPAEWQEDQRERWNQARQELNKLADVVVEKHQELVRIAKNLLHV